MSNAVLPVYGPSPVVFERGEGVRMYDDKGKPYLDFIAGIAVNSLGHCHPALVKALTEQANKLWHTSNMFRVPGQERLAQRYVDLTFADFAFFTNSGAESIEGCIKIARRYHWSKGQPERIGIISFEGSFHGRTLGGINAGAQEKYLEGFGPRLPGFRSIPWGDVEALKAEIVKPDLAAVIIEPVQGEGGVREAKRGLPARRSASSCDENGVLLIYDEIQCGAGRTGKLFHHQWIKGAEPDLLAAAKGIGGGFPMGMVLATREGRLRHGQGHPRHHLRRQSAGDGRRQRRARRGGRRRLPRECPPRRRHDAAGPGKPEGPLSRTGASTSPAAACCAACACTTIRCRCVASSPTAACSSAGRRQRAAPRAAADRHRGRCARSHRHHRPAIRQHDDGAGS